MSTIDEDFDFMTSVLSAGVDQGEKEVFLSLKPAVMRTFKESLARTEYSDTYSTFPSTSSTTLPSSVSYCSTDAYSAAYSYQSKLSETTKSCSSKCCQNKCEKCGINEDDCHCGKRSSEARLKTEAYRKSMQEWSINKSCDFSNCTAQL